VVGRPAFHDLEAVPLVEANVGHCHLGGLERQAARPRARATSSIRCNSQLPTPVPCRAGSTAICWYVEVFLLRFRPDGTDDALTIQSDVDLARSSSAANRSRSSANRADPSAGQLAPQSADIGREGLRV